MHTFNFISLRKPTLLSILIYTLSLLKVYYRIHASILKSLESMEGKYLSTEVESLYEETLNEAACSPFMATRSQSRPSL